MPLAHEIRSCRDKKAYPLRWKAQAAAFGINKMNRNRGDDAPMHAYLCDFGEHYHIGHRGVGFVPSNSRR